MIINRANLQSLKIATRVVIIIFSGRLLMKYYPEIKSWVLSFFL